MFIIASVESPESLQVVMEFENDVECLQSNEKQNISPRNNIFII